MPAKKGTSKSVQRDTARDTAKKVAAAKNSGTTASSAAVNTSAKCSVCCQAIVDGSDQALFCEGDRCQSWMHRYCAGVPANYFVSLSESSSPFFCYSCVQAKHQHEITELKKSLESLMHNVAVMRDELVNVRQSNSSGVISLETKICNLDERLCELKSKAQECNSTDCCGMGFAGGGKRVGGWNSGAIGRAGMGRYGRGRDSGVGDRVGMGQSGRDGVGGKGHQKTVGSGMSRSDLSRGGNGNGVGGFDSGGARERNAFDANLGTQRKRVPVENARKIWGTLRSATHSVVSNVIKRTLSEPLAVRLNIKRKYREDVRGIITKWWYVVRGTKSDIELLERNWVKISMHTGWKLESVFCFEDKNTPTTDEHIPSATSPTTTPTIDKFACSSGTDGAVVNTTSNNASCELLSNSIVQGNHSNDEAQLMTRESCSDSHAGLSNIRGDDLPTND